MGKGGRTRRSVERRGIRVRNMGRVLRVCGGKLLAKIADRTFEHLLIINISRMSVIFKPISNKFNFSVLSCFFPCPEVSTT